MAFLIYFYLGVKADNLGCSYLTLYEYLLPLALDELLLE